MAKRGRPRLPARLKVWKGEQHVFYTDRSGGKPITKRVLCSAHGATNAEERRELLGTFRRLEQEQRAEEDKFGSLGYGTSLCIALDNFKKHVEAQAALREQSTAARIGIARTTKKSYLDTLKRFKAWLKSNDLLKITTGKLHAEHLSRFFDELASEKAHNGKSKHQRGAHTLNKHRRQLRTALLNLAGQRPPLFPDIDQLKTAFKPLRTDNTQPSSFSPNQLTAFLAEALSDEAVETVDVKRTVKSKSTVQRFEQTLGERNRPVAKVSRLFLVLALTGCRRGEALSLKFRDIDMDTGVIRIKSVKTGGTRWVPLLDVGKKIGPQFLSLLAKWKMQGTTYVVSDREAGEPGFPKGPWNRISRKCRLREMGPQALRQNFTSYAAALGVPATIASLWQGHSSAIAEKWYRTLVLSRIDADDFETSMGLTRIISKLISGGEAEVISMHRKKNMPPSAVAS